MKGVRITSKMPPRIRHRGPAHPLVAPGLVAGALEAERVGVVTPGVDPPSFVALRHEIARRLTSTGGRPALEGTGRRQKIPLDDDDWARLCVLADRIGAAGPRPTPGQIASALLRLALANIDGRHRSVPRCPEP